MTELAIYGGTFAPVHIGHVRAAETFYSFVKPDKMLLIPTLIPPHKQIDFEDDPADRYEMLQLAFCEHPDFDKKIFLSDYELTAPPPSYTVNTLRHFSAPDTHITFLCGTDMFLTLDKWYKPREIMGLCRIAFMRRANESPKTEKKISEQIKNLTENYGADILILPGNPIEISSSEIRSGNDELRKKYLPEKVYKYINEKGMYKNDN